MEENNNPPSIDWRDVARTALGSAFIAGIAAGALYVVGKVLEDVQLPTPEIVEPSPTDEADHPADEVDEDAKLLGVSPDASEDSIRAALRERLSASRLHPDHGGDGEEASQLIAARNRLVEHVRARRAGS
jgi:hypothetical protein